MHSADAAGKLNQPATFQFGCSPFVSHMMNNVEKFLLGASHGRNRTLVLLSEGNGYNWKMTVSSLNRISDPVLRHWSQDQWCAAHFSFSFFLFHPTLSTALTHFLWLGKSLRTLTISKSWYFMSCIPKDVRVIQTHKNLKNLNVPLCFLHRH